MDYYDRINVFASYIGSTIRHKLSDEWGGLRGVVGETVYIQKASDPNRTNAPLVLTNTDVILLLHKVNFISDMHAKELGLLINSQSKNPYQLGFDIAKNILVQKSEYSYDFFIAQKIIDFLRKNSYALPYKNYSVDELVKFGIYKLT